MNVKIYSNKRNGNKYLEVHNDGHRHNAVRQFMNWKNVGVTNYLGDGNLHRWRKNNLIDLLEDYELVDEYEIVRERRKRI